MAYTRTIVESKRWFSPSTGRTASIYGSVPWVGDQGDWRIETVGWTIQYNDNGRITVGNGRPPFKTWEAAKEWLDRTA